MLRIHTGGGAVHSLAFTPDGRLVVEHSLPGDDPRRRARELVWCDPHSATVIRRFRLWDTLMGPRGGLRGTPHEERGYSENQPPIAVSFCPRTNRVVIAWPWHSVEDPVVVYDLDRDAAECFRFWARIRLQGVAFAPDGRSIVQAIEYQRVDMYALRVWPADTTGRFAVEWEGGDARVEIPGAATALAFDGRYAVVKVEIDANGELTEDGPYLWDSTAGPDAIRLLEPGFVSRVFAFAESAPFLAVGGDRLAVRNLEKSRWVASLRPSAEVRSLAFDPAGRRLAAGLQDGTLLLTDRDGRRPAPPLTTCADAVTAVAFAPDGLTCAAGGWDGQVVIWDVDE